MVFRSYGGFLVFIIICSCLAAADVTETTEATTANKLSAADHEPSATATTITASAATTKVAATTSTAAVTTATTAAATKTAATTTTTTAGATTPVAANQTRAAAGKLPEAAGNNDDSSSIEGEQVDDEDHGGGLGAGDESDDTSPPPASPAAENDRPADDDDVEYVESVVDESIEEYSAVESQPEDTELETTELVVPVAKSTQFLPYFIAAVVLFVVLYLGYHQRNKIIALIVEGKRSLSKKKREPRPKAGEYSRLTTSTEDVDSRAKGFTY